MLEHKIDFMVTVEVKEANANGDPLSGNMPRTNAKGYGLMSDVSIKRKIRNRLQDMGQSIFVQANERIEDEFRSLENRFSAQFDKNDKDDDIERRANELWLDVRSFGQVFTYLKKSIGVRGLCPSAWLNPWSQLSSQAFKSHAVPMVWSLKGIVAVHLIRWEPSTLSIMVFMSLKDQSMPILQKKLALVRKMLTLLSKLLSVFLKMMRLQHVLKGQCECVRSFGLPILAN